MATETLYTIAAERHGILVLARNFGTLREGGEFESVYVRIMQYQNGWLVGVEMFEPEDLAAARARFEEMRPRTSPARSPDRNDAGGAP